MKALLDRMLTHQRKVTFVAWVTTVWASLQSSGHLTWPLTRDQWIAIIGVTITMLGRSVLAPAKTPEPVVDAAPQEPQA